MGAKTHTISLGCRLNTYETERMGALASAKGDGETVVINTCAVTNEAVRQSRQAIRRARKDHPSARIVVSGCAADIDHAAFSAMAEVDRVIANAEKLAPTAWGLPASATPDVPSVDARAHLEVQNGCDHSCTFCIIPTGRGAARSRPIAEITTEAARLADLGAKEIVLTGVDLTSYGPDLGDGVTLADPVEALLEALPGDVRIRLSSVDGAEVDNRLFALITGEARIAPYLHLSLQAGDDMILKRMKRRHARADAVALTDRLRAARPDMLFGADLIAGFPTETEEMFANTLALVEDCGLTFVHVFPFSPRTGTPAAKMPQLPRAEVKARAAALRAVADEALSATLDRAIGTRTDILVETSKAGRRTGKTANFMEVVIEGEGPTHCPLHVELIARDGRHLIAQPTDHK